MQIENELKLRLKKQIWKIELQFKKEVMKQDVKNFSKEYARKK